MNKIDREEFEKHLVWAEAERLYLYKDSQGIYTIGVGHNIQEKGISKRASRVILQDDIDEVFNDVRNLDYFAALDPVRQLVVADMVFNLGLTKFIRFVKLNAALAIHDYTLAAHEMIDSKWFRQTGRRARKLVRAMRTGEWKDARRT